MGDNTNTPTPKQVKILYIVVIIVWIVLIYFLKIYNHKSSFVLLIPLIIFGVMIWKSDTIHDTVGENVNMSTYASIGIYFAIPLLGWIGGEHKAMKPFFTTVVSIALVMWLLALIPLWVTSKYAGIYRHFQSSIYTMSICLFLFGILHYFCHVSK